MSGPGRTSSGLPRPNQFWLTDLFSFVLKGQNRRVYLVAFMDDHIRCVAGYGLHASQSSALVLEMPTRCAAESVDFDAMPEPIDLSTDTIFGVITYPPGQFDVAVFVPDLEMWLTANTGTGGAVPGRPAVQMLPIESFQERKHEYESTYKFDVLLYCAVCEKDVNSSTEREAMRRFIHRVLSLMPKGPQKNAPISRVPK